VSNETVVVWGPTGYIISLRGHTAHNVADMSSATTLGTGDLYGTATTSLSEATTGIPTSGTTGVCPSTNNNGAAMPARDRDDPVHTSGTSIANGATRPTVGLAVFAAKAIATATTNIRRGATNTATRDESSRTHVFCPPTRVYTGPAF
jgi:hypothetical protein